MPAAPFSPTEARRFAAVRRIGLLGTPAEERFDKITRLARQMFNVSMSIIDIVGSKMAWLKSIQGFDGLDVPRQHSYCHYTVLSDEICFVRDARLDTRLFDNPFASSFVFYAGVPLKFEGENVGVLCIADAQPRDMSAEEMKTLADLASLVEHELEVAVLSESQIRLALSNEELQMKSMVDELTRLWNRGAILELAARELEQGRAAQQPTGVILLDIDHFKRINDEHGHQGGDEVLRQVGARLRASVRPGDAVGRYGGEEFLIVLPRAGKDETFAIGERVRAFLELEPVLYGEIPITMTCSAGCTVSLDGSHFVEMLVRAADEGLYRAKRQGRNRVSTSWISGSIAPAKLRLGW